MKYRNLKELEDKLLLTGQQENFEEYSYTTCFSPPTFDLPKKAKPSMTLLCPENMSVYRRSVERFNHFHPGFVYHQNRTFGKMSHK